MTSFVSYTKGSCTGPKGKLTINVIEGRDLLVVQLIGKQDPYVKLQLGKEKFKTRTHDNGGQFPKWNQSFIFNLSGHESESHLHFTCKDENVVSDTDIGRSDLPMSHVLEKSGDRWIQLVDVKDFSKMTGQIKINVHFDPAPGQPSFGVSSPSPSPAPAGANRGSVSVPPPAPAAAQAPVPAPVSPTPASAPPQQPLYPPLNQSSPVYPQQQLSSPVQQYAPYPSAPPPQQPQPQPYPPQPQQYFTQQPQPTYQPAFAPQPVPIQPVYQAAPAIQPVYQPIQPVYQPPIQPVYQQPVVYATQPPPAIQIAQHPHPLYHQAFVYSGTYGCNICGQNGSGGVYHCGLCNWDAHVHCVRF